MTFTQINVFIEVVRLKNFTRVGEKLGMTQSAVSHAIISLEKHLDIKLLIRSNKGLKLTEHGDMVYQLCLDIQSNSQQIYDNIKQIKKIPATTLKIGVLPSIALSILPKIISRFNNLYPQVELILFEGSDDEVVNWIVSGTVDIGFTTQTNQGFHTVHILEDEMRIILPNKHKLTTQKAIKPSQLINEDFIMSSSGCQPLIENIFNQYDLRPKVKYRVSSLPTILEMIKENVGISILPELALKNFTSPFIEHRSQNPKQFRQVNLSATVSIKENIILAEFIDVCQRLV